MRKEWTTEEVDYVKANHKRMSIEQMSFDLNRSYASVITKYRSLGIIKSSTRSKFKGCDEDCEHCVYDDCYRPDTECLKGEPKRRRVKGRKYNVKEKRINEQPREQI